MHGIMQIYLFDVSPYCSKADRVVEILMWIRLYQFLSSHICFIGPELFVM